MICSFTARSQAAGGLIAGDGFIVPEDDVVAQTRSGKQVLNVRGDVTALICTPVAGDTVAVVGENRKVLVFGWTNCPKWAAAKVCGCKNTRTAACLMRRLSRAPTG